MVVDDLATLGLVIDTRQVKTADKSLDKLNKRAALTEKATNKIKRGFDVAGFGARALAGGLAAIMASLSVGPIIRYADSWVLTNGRLKLVTETTWELVHAEEELFKISQDTRQAYSSTADLYARIARNAKSLHLEQSTLLQVTDAINKSLVISGSSAASSDAALIQLGQAFASGTLRGQELNSVMEQTPRLAEAIAVGMGMGLGELRKQAALGAITSEAIIKALLDQSNAIDKEFGQMRRTVGQTMTMISNSFQRYIGEADDAHDATLKLTEGLGFVAENLELFIQGGIVLASMGLPWVFTAIATAVKGLTLALLANPLGLFIAAISGGIAALIVFKDETITLGNTTATVANFVGGVWDTAAETFSTAWGNAYKWFEEESFRVFAAVGVFSETAFGNVLSFGRFAINKLIASFMIAGETIGAIAAWIVSAFEGVAPELETVLDSLDESMQAAFSTDYIQEFGSAATLMLSEIGDSIIRNTEIRSAASKLELDLLGDNSDASKKNIKTETSLTLDSIETQSKAYGKMFGAVGNMFDEQTKERKTMHKLEQAFAIIETALLAKKAIMSAVAAISNQGSGDPYTAFARIAAMVGTMAGLLSGVGLSFGGSGGGGGSVAPGVNTGTVLGNTAATSESTANILDFFDDIHAKEYRELRGIHTSMEMLNTNITGLVNSIGRSVAAGGGVLSGVGFGYEASAFEKASDNVSEFFAIDFSNWLGPLTEALSGGIGSLVGLIAGGIGAIFGGGVETKLKGQGFEIAAITAGEIQAGAEAYVREFAFIKEHTKGGLFSSGSSKYYTLYTQANDDITRLFTSILGNLSTSLSSLALGLGGVEAETKALAFEFDIGQIDLQGKTSEEISEAILAAISFQADVAAEAVLAPIVGMYQAVEEGLFETAARMFASKVVIEDSLRKSGIEIEGVTLAIVDNISNLAGGLTSFQESFELFFDLFFSDAEKQTERANNLTGIFEDLNMILPATREGYRNLVDALNITNEADQQRYVNLLALAEQADAYYSFLEDQQQELLRSQENAISLSISNLQGLASSIDSVLDALSKTQSSARNLRLESQMILESAIGEFQTTGGVSDVDSIQKALSVLAQPSEGLFENFIDYQRDFQTTKNSIVNLGDLTQNALSVEERMLELLTNDSVLDGVQHDEVMQSLTLIREAVLTTSFGEQLSAASASTAIYTTSGTNVASPAGTTVNINILTELKKLREEQELANFTIAKNTKDVGKLLSRWDVDGLPEERIVI